MVNIAQDEPRPLPAWLMIGVSVLVIGHFAAIIGIVLNAPSGPWMPGAPPIAGPQFAAPLEQAAAAYLPALRMTHTYHFRVDRAKPSVYLEINLKEEDGRIIKTLKLPDPKANLWVRHRQQLLADGLFDDYTEAVGGVRLGAPAKTVWQQEKENHWILRKVPEEELPRNQPVQRPSDWSQLLAKAYVRHLCRTHGAAAAEIVRHSRDIVLPPTWLPPPPGQDQAEVPPMLFTELVYNFGVSRRED